MEGDLSADFHLNHGPASYLDGATIHLHYLPGDSFLDSFRKVDSTLLLSSQAVPLESQAGNVIFPCGTVTHAGPHRAYLTILRNSSLSGVLPRRVTVAKSKVLYVSWPQMAVSVPEKLETYSLNVDVRISFTRTLCSTLLRQEEDFVRSSNLRFAPRLELVECSKSLVNPYSQDCQISNEAKIWYSYTLPPNFYQRAAMEVSINCSYWGQEGTYRTFLRTDLTHVPIIARSKPIVVERNPVYRLSTNYKSIYPCLENDIKPINVERPFCASGSDRIQVYGQAYSLSGNNLIVPSSHWKYLGNKRVPGGLEELEESAHIPCSFFSREFLQVCFKYVSYSIIGTSNVTTSLCLPTEEIDSHVLSPSWSGWSAWSSCSTSLCREEGGSLGYRSRHRYCQFPQGRDKKHLICEEHSVVVYANEFGMSHRNSLGNDHSLLYVGSPVDREEGCDAGFPLCNDVNSIRLDSNNDNDPGQALEVHNNKIYYEEESVESPCSCGCIYLVQQNSRRLVIRSRSSCFDQESSPSQRKKRPLHWKIKASMNYTVSAVANLVEFECPGSWFNFREGSNLNDDIINQMKIPKHNNSVNSNTNFITIELTPVPFVNTLLMNNGQESRIDCRFLLILEVFKKERIKKSRNVIPRQPMTGLNSILTSVIHYLSVAGIIFLSIISVFLACLICVVFQFEHRRKKYMEWQSRPSSGTCTPDEENMELIHHPETSHEELPLLASDTTELKNSLSKLSKKMTWRRLLEHLRALREEEKRSKLSRRRSLQELALFSSTPSLWNEASTAEKRKSRSVSDIASLISFKIPQDEPKTDCFKENTPFQKKTETEEDQISTTSTIRPMRITSPTIKSSRSTLNSNTLSSSKPHRRYRYHHRNSDLSSVSSFLSSRQSLDMEYDLYDCNIENVAAIPGSNFVAEKLLDERKAAIKEEEEYDTKTLKRMDAMIESQTSDLTSSIISTNTEHAFASLKNRDTMNISGYHSGDEDETDFQESDKLLTLQKKNLMSITHIDDEEVPGTSV
ncbi:unnamed protein product [Lepeophtheirus salmonis]|uniref:(salmon louse) hypothetical protein n=1 Tax=Lepeophtheirus salmonis TaxID=72036 RepID=A0A7R8D8F1_LEPSM|nr:unnamed protein product [Lepeophtheirus salmonis]CAF3036174.1 unnamed protein product [Lepeophtheirus salmonis]